MGYNWGTCSKCGNRRLIVNKTHNLCWQCNQIRLHGDNKKRKVKKTNINAKAIQKDEEFYEKIFYLKPCRCENCGKPLPTKFRDENGKIIARYQYSHVLSKGAYPQYRYEEWNIMKNCLKCHQQWDFGVKQDMPIYNKYKKLIIEKTGKDLLV